MRSWTRVFNAVALAVAVYGFACWAYVAAVALVLPQTLTIRLTHLASWPRTDTFGELSFALSFVAFIAYMLTRRCPAASEVSESGRYGSE
jgi:hypothetical protein